MMFKRENRGPLTPEQEQEEIARTRMPKPPEVFGVATEMLGSGRLRVDCDDGLTRICRIPGKLRRRVWVRVGDLVLVEPWSVQGHERADIIWKYTRTQSNWLRKRGIFKKIQWG